MTIFEFLEQWVIGVRDGQQLQQAVLDGPLRGSAALQSTRAARRVMHGKIRRS
jgi:hypothetical protein